MSLDMRQSTRKYVLANSVKITTGAASAVTTNPVGCSEVLLVATAALWFTTGSAPTAVAATAGNVFMAAGEKFHMQIDPADKIAAIQDAAAGGLYIIPIG